MEGRPVLALIAATIVVVAAQVLGLPALTVLGLTTPNLTLLTLGTLAIVAGFSRGRRFLSCSRTGPQRERVRRVAR